MLVKEILFKDLNNKQKEIIKKLSTLETDDFETEDFNNYAVSGIFVFNNTKEGGDYWRNITLEEFEKDRLLGKFDYLNPKKELSDEINEIINKLQKIK